MCELWTFLKITYIILLISIKHLKGSIYIICSMHTLCNFKNIEYYNILIVLRVLWLTQMANR
jgi:hypothetical protein